MSQGFTLEATGLVAKLGKSHAQPHIRKEETMTEALEKDYEKTCQERIDEQWQQRREDLKDPEFEGLGFDYVEPHTFTDQLEGYWRWQFSWGGPSDELRAFVNENKEIHRLEYWFMDWMDGAKLELQRDAEVWGLMQDWIEASA
jgi:hypothetical protein